MVLSFELLGNSLSLRKTRGQKRGSLRRRWVHLESLGLSLCGLQDRDPRHALQGSNVIDGTVDLDFSYYYTP